MELLFSFLSKLVYKCAYISNLPLQDPVLNFWVSNFYGVLFGVFLGKEIKIFETDIYCFVLLDDLLTSFATETRLDKRINSSFWAPSK